MNLLSRRKIQSLTRKVTALHNHRQNNPVSDSELRKEIHLYHTLANLHDRYRFDRDMPHAELFALENYRAAANLGDSKAQYIVGKRLMERGQFWDGLQTGPYATAVHEKYATDCYREALAFFKTADEQGHVQAQRLHGLLYVNGWGVAKDEDKGLQMIVSSIEQENDWDKASEIFAELDLHKPEIFAAIMSGRNQPKSDS